MEAILAALLKTPIFTSLDPSSQMNFLAWCIEIHLTRLTRSLVTPVLPLFFFFVCCSNSLWRLFVGWYWIPENLIINLMLQHFLVLTFEISCCLRGTYFGVSGIMTSWCYDDCWRSFSNIKTGPPKEPWLMNGRKKKILLVEWALRLSCANDVELPSVNFAGCGRETIPDLLVVQRWADIVCTNCWLLWCHRALLRKRMS